MAKPVMGTSVPAPACLAMLSYTFNAVRIALAAIRVIEQTIRAVFKSIPAFCTRLTIPCPRAQISPPIKNALTQFFSTGDLGAVCLFICRYSCPVTSMKNAPLAEFPAERGIALFFRTFRNLCTPAPHPPVGSGIREPARKAAVRKKTLDKRGNGCIIVLCK